MLKFFLIAAGLPLAAVVGNSILRLALRLPQSAPADLILVLIVFDIVILIEPADLEGAIPNVRLFYGFVALGSVIMWMIALGRIERDLRAWMAARPRRGYPFRLMLASLGMSGLALVANLAPLAWRSFS
jgi:hypothetical protein